MAFLRSTLTPEPTPVMRGNGLLLRPPHSADYAAWAELRAASRDHLMPWEPLWAGDELSRGAYRRRLRLYQQEQREDQGYAFFIFDEVSDALLGGLTLSNVRRGVTQAATLGYWVGERHSRRGVMTRAVGLVSAYVFDELRLHRLEAACLENNVASAKVLTRCGFTREGLARKYLKINGEWRDHVLYATVAEDRAGTGRDGT